MALSNAERQRLHRERVKAKLAQPAPVEAPDIATALRGALRAYFAAVDAEAAERDADHALRDLEVRLAGWLSVHTALDGAVPEDDRDAALLDAWRAAIRIPVPSMEDIRAREAEEKRARRAPRRRRETRQPARHVSLVELVIQNAQRVDVT